MDPLAFKYAPVSPYAYCGSSPIRFSDFEGLDWWDKAVGVVTGIVTNIIPGSSPLRDVYSPTEASDYNAGLFQADAATMKAAQIGGRTGMGAMATGAAVVAGGVTAVATVGGAPVGAGLTGTGATVAIGGAKIAGFSALLAINASTNASEGYERGHSDGGNNNSDSISFTQGRNVTVHFSALPFA